MAEVTSTYHEKGLKWLFFLKINISFILWMKQNRRGYGILLDWYTPLADLFRNQMSHENEAIFKKSVFDERKWGETLETYSKF